MYDRENSKVGFWKTNCSELWERLHISDVPSPAPSNSEITNLTKAFEPSVAPSPAPSNSEITNLTKAFEPSVAPSPAPSPAPSQDNIDQGELQIAQITISISFNISYTDMKPHITELAGLIAHELDVNTSQVHLMNLSSLGNGSLSRWAIIPRPYADFFSNTTAMSMVSRLSEHRMQLPDTFGSYKLLDWNAEPSSKRTWWQQYYWVVALMGLITLLLGVSALGIFLVWKNRQQAEHSYKPVDVAVPEQELQPL